MKQPIKIVLFICVAVFTVAFFGLVGICIAMIISYSGNEMGNEAYGFFSAALLLTFVIGIPTGISWMLLMKHRKQNQVSK